jgi:hypothetical protein
LLQKLRLLIIVLFCIQRLAVSWYFFILGWSDTDYVLLCLLLRRINSVFSGSFFTWTTGVNWFGRNWLGLMSERVSLATRLAAFRKPGQIRCFVD